MGSAMIVMLVGVVMFLPALQSMKLRYFRPRRVRCVSLFSSVGLAFFLVARYLGALAETMDLLAVTA